MNINTRELGFVNFNGEEMQWVNFNGVNIYEAWKKLIASGIPPLKLINCKGYTPKLPEEYQELEYIQNEGNQYIDTGVLANENNSFEVKAQLVHANNTSQTVWGGRHSSTASRLQGNQLSCVKSTGNYQFICGNTNIEAGAWNTDLHTFYANKNKLYIDGKLVRTITSATITEKNNVYLFATNTAGTVGFNGGSLKIYYCKIWNGDVLIRHLIPCYRKSDNEVGMYDMIENKFYANAGDGTFLKGKEVGVSLLDYKVYGESVQESDNLFDPSMTLTDNLYLSNTGTEVSNSNWKITDYIEVEGYSFTLTNVGGQNPSICAYDENKNFITGVKYGTNSAVEKTNVVISSTILIKYIRFSVYRPYILDGNINDVTLSYNPTPDTPIEIESVGDKTKNLFSLNSYEGIVDWGGNDKKTMNMVTVKPNTYYTLSFQFFERIDPITGGGISIYIYNNASLSETGRVHAYSINASGSAEPIRFKETFKSGDNTELYVVIRNTSGTKTQIKIEGLMLEEGNTATEYEPNGYKIPIKVTPTLYDFNPEKINTYQYSASQTRSAFDLGILEAGEYVFDMDLVEEGLFPVYLYIRCKLEDGSFSSAIYVTTDRLFTPVKFTADGTSNYYLFFAYSSHTVSVAKTQWERVKNAYLQKGTEIKSYRTNIYLNEPLRKIGDYTDYIDFENQKVFRNVGQEVYDENTIFNLSTSTYFYEPGITTAFTKSIPTDALPDSLGMTCITNLLEHKKANALDKTKPYISGNTSQNVFVVKNETATTVEELKAFLANNNMQIVYPLKEETPENINLPNIVIQKGINIIEIDTSVQPSNLEVKYLGKK